MELKHFQKAQIYRKQQKTEEEYRRELDAATRANALIDQNEKEFYSYAEKCIKEWQSAGKNVVPLILELKNYKKKVVT